jgi:hypothetical protein
MATRTNCWARWPTRSPSGIACSTLLETFDGVKGLLRRNDWCVAC